MLMAPRFLSTDSLAVGEACEWLRSVMPELRSALDREGVLLLRGLPFSSADDFGRLRDAIVSQRAEYRERATPRTSFGGDVFSSTNFPVDQRIMLHNENSYTLTFPGIVLFGCLTAAAEGGATPVADCRKVLRAIPGSLADRFRDTGWGLVRNYTDYFGLGWRTAFGTEDPDQVLRYCADNKIGASWEAEGRLRTVQRRSALIRHPRLGDEVWFNHVAFWSVWSLAEDVRGYLLSNMTMEELPYNTVFGDGKPLTAEEAGQLAAAYDSATLRETWRPGDIMLVDNLLAAHGRDPYRGDRTILVAMGERTDLAECAPTVEPSPALAA
jgi:hypothetical protein